jgi:RimJ/RimL family protein N-acetyltransferase
MENILSFHKITAEDLVFLNEVRNGYCEEFLHDSRKFNIKETKEWFSKYRPDYYMIKINGENIGYFRLSNYSKENKNIYLGADISPKYKGFGYGKLSYIKFIPFLFEEYLLNKISLEVLSTNKVALNLYKKLGFTVEGVKRQEILKNGEWVDSIMMSMLKKEYLNNTINF